MPPPRPALPAAVLARAAPAARGVAGVWVWVACSHAAGALAAPPASPAPAPAHAVDCPATAETVFRCDTGARRVAVCFTPAAGQAPPGVGAASPAAAAPAAASAAASSATASPGAPPAGAAAPGGVLQYRFGRAHRLELALPPSAAAPGVDAQAGVLRYSGGGGAWLGFVRQEHRYVVYTAIGRGWGERAGVVVERAGQRVAHLRCSRVPDVVSALGPALFERAGLAVRDDGFELP